MVSALVVCAAVLQNNNNSNLGSIPTIYSFSTRLAVLSQIRKYFFPAQTKLPTLASRNTWAANQVCLGKKTVEELLD